MLEKVIVIITLLLIGFFAYLSMGNNHLLVNSNLNSYKPTTIITGGNVVNTPVKSEDQIKSNTNYSSQEDDYTPNSDGMNSGFNILVPKNDSNTPTFNASQSQNPPPVYITGSNIAPPSNTQLYYPSQGQTYQQTSTGGNNVGGNNTTTSCLNSVSNPADARQMWVWPDVATDNKQLLVSGTQTYNDFFTFVDSHKVQIAYMYLPAGFLNVPTNASTLKSFLNVAKNNHCLSVEALDGDIDWADITVNNYAKDFVDAVKNFNASVPSGSVKLIGLQYDVEPRGMNVTVGNKLLDMLQMAKNDLSGTGILLDLAPARWYDTAAGLTSSEFIRTGGGTGKSLMQYIVDITDVVTIQDYIQNSVSIYNDGQGELDYAASVGKKVRIGVDTASGDGANTSFGDVAGMTCNNFNSILTDTYNMMNSNEKSSFGGFAVEFYKGANNTPFAYSKLCP